MSYFDEHICKYNPIIEETADMCKAKTQDNILLN